MNTITLLTLVGVPSILSFLFQVIFKAVSEKRQKESETEKWKRLGVQALLRDRLQQGYRYFTEKGYCSITDKSNYENLHKCYQNLGQNGVMDKLVEEVMNLPIKEWKK